jgi:Cd2+/Zn2+-exporting ATPase
MTQTDTVKELACCPHCAAGAAKSPGKTAAAGGELFKILAGALVFGAGLLLERLLAPFPLVSLGAFIAAYVVLGGEILLRAGKNIVRGRVFDENFLMTLASLGAFAIGEYPEAVGVMLFYQIGEYFQDMAVRGSRKSITDLMDIRPDFANRLRDGAMTQVDPGTVEIGELIAVRPGEKVPLDGVVVEGRSMLDTRALTGESLPREAAPGDTVLSGCVNQDGLLTVRVTKTFGESTAAKILDLVENAAGKKAPAENFVTAFSRYYTPAVVALAALIALVPPLFAGFTGEGLSAVSWAEWINRGLIFLVISCPCALVVSIPLGFFGGIGRASGKGILVKGGNYLEALNKVDLVVFDKTGTLTRGVFKVTALRPAEGFTERELLELAVRAEAFSSHPIAVSIREAFGGDPDREKLSEYREIPGRGVSVKAGGKTILAGSRKLMEAADIPVPAAPELGATVYVALEGKFAGLAVISDEVKADSRSALGALKKAGVRKTVMLTGDDPRIAETVAGELGIDEVYGGLLPGEKVEKVEELSVQKRPGRKLVFMGDGINDAPVLARADIGVAMGGLGSDAAIEAADIVLMTDEPSKLAEAIGVARVTRRVVWQNIIFALGFKGLFLVMGAFGLATMWEAVFADVGVCLIAILNAARITRMK